MTDLINDIARALDSGAVIPYMGPDMLGLCADIQVPATPLALAESMTAKVSVPHKIRKRLTQAAQFIENFKHRQTLVAAMAVAAVGAARAATDGSAIRGVMIPLKAGLVAQTANGGVVAFRIQ